MVNNVLMTFLMHFSEGNLLYFYSNATGVCPIVSQFWFRWWLGAAQATNHFLNQLWPSWWRIMRQSTIGHNWFKYRLWRVYATSYVTMPQWVNSLCSGAALQSGTKPNLVAKILATKFGFVPDCSMLSYIMVIIGLDYGFLPFIHGDLPPTCMRPSRATVALH